MAWSCEQCGRHVTNELLCDLCGTGKPGADPEKVRAGVQRDLVMESHLGALAIWYRIGAVLFALVAAWALLSASTVAHHDVMFVLDNIVRAAAVALLLAGAGSFVLGHFLARRSNVARIIAGVLGSLSLLLTTLRMGVVLFADSTPRYASYDSYHYSAYHQSSGVGYALFFFAVNVAWTCAVLWALFNRRAGDVCSGDYAAIVERTPELRPTPLRSPFFFLPLAAACFGLLILTIVALPRL